MHVWWNIELLHECTSLCGDVCMVCCFQVLGSILLQEAADECGWQDELCWICNKKGLTDFFISLVSPPKLQPTMQILFFFIGLFICIWWWEPKSRDWRREVETGIVITLKVVHRFQMFRILIVGGSVEFFLLNVLHKLIFVYWAELSLDYDHILYHTNNKSGSEVVK